MREEQVTLYNKETGEELTMRGVYASYMIRVNPDWSENKPVEAEDVVVVEEEVSNFGKFRVKRVKGDSCEKTEGKD